MTNYKKKIITKNEKVRVKNQNSKKVILFSTISVSIILLLTATAVPVTQGETLMEKINQNEGLKKLFSNSLLGNYLKRNEKNEGRLSKFFETISQFFNEKTSKLKNNIKSIELLNKPLLGGTTTVTLAVLVILCVLLLMKIVKEIIGTSVGTVGKIISMFWQGIRIIGSIVRLAFLSAAAVQTTLAIFAFIILIMGILSKNLIKLIATISAPLVSVIALIFTKVAGSIIGWFSLAVHVTLASVVFLLPLILIILVPILMIILLLSAGSGSSLSTQMAAVAKSS